MQRRYLRSFGGQRPRASGQDAAEAEAPAPAPQGAKFSAKFHIDRYSVSVVTGWATDPTCAAQLANPGKHSTLPLHFLLLGWLLT